uniref:Myosin_tail_1 domain-containing protein n=1 Tax=Rhabditophanes sp. KR3021 TaxID=114890 RepID=A0AC35TI39_9BILA
MADTDECKVFEPQSYLKDRCKKCFKLKSKHSQEAVKAAEKNTVGKGVAENAQVNGNISKIATKATAMRTKSDVSNSKTKENVTSLTVSKPEKRRSFREKGKDDGEDNDDDTVSLISYKSAYSKGLSSAKSLESIMSNIDTRSMVTAVSGSIEEDDRVQTPTHDTGATEGRKNLQRDIARLSDEIKRLKEERNKWVTSKKSAGGGQAEMSLIEFLEERLATTECYCDELRQENECLRYDNSELQQEINETQYGEEGNDDFHDKRNNGVDNYKITGHEDEFKSNGSINISKDVALTEKLNTTESFCDELMQENECLKADVRELQQEIEEMQDQYREEEIEEFRELQKDLESNAKNCRVLQFKLRKAERVKDQLQAEKDHAEMKLKEMMVVAAANGGESNVNSKMDHFKIMELESELRIAKEVSIRLHTDLEAADQKRFKMEDEVFYLKEKVRELQTQEKWRSSRNKVEQVTKRASLELNESMISSDDVNKDLRDVLEREIDLREQLKYTEEDLKRSQDKVNDIENENEELLRKLTKMSQNGNSRNRPPITRSASDSINEDKTQTLTVQNQELKEQVASMEKKNISLAKKLLEYEIEATKKSHAEAEALAKMASGASKNSVEIEADINRLMKVINDLEKKNTDLRNEIVVVKVNPIESLSNGDVNGHDLTNDALKERAQLIEQVNKEKEIRKGLESELSEMKQIIGKSDNQKLITFAAKVDSLNEKIKLAQERYNAICKKNIQTKNADLAGEHTLVDQLNERIQLLESKLSELRANVAYGLNAKNKNVAADEIEQCCEVLAAIEAQTNRICKQVEKLDSTGVKDERRRSLSKENGANIIAELANVMNEFNNVKKLLESHKKTNPDNYRNYDDVVAEKVTPVAKECKGCKESNEKIESQKSEIEFYKKKNKDLTNQVLQTEDRWTSEIEKQRNQFGNDIDELTRKLEDGKKKYSEQTHLIESYKTNISEKDKVISDKDMKCIKLRQEIQEKLKQMLESEKEMKALKEFEIKHKKLETMLEQEKDKIKSERGKFKNEMSSLRKKAQDTLADIEQLRYSHQERENVWNSERNHLKDEVAILKKAVAKLGDESSESEHNSQLKSVKSNSSTVIRVTRPAEQTILNELREKIGHCEKRNCLLENELVKIRMEKEELEVTSLKISKANIKDRDELKHKLLQADKIKAMEIDALQQKFASRMNIMENTNKSLQSNLVQSRRERDHHKEGLLEIHKKIEQDHKKFEQENKKMNELTSKLIQSDKKVSELDINLSNLQEKLKLSQSAHVADKNLWSVEKTHILRANLMNGTKDNNPSGDRQIAEEALKAGEIVQKQYAEYQKFFKREVERLNLKIKQLTEDMRDKENNSAKMIKELREQIRVLEIDQKNLKQNKDVLLSAREAIQVDHDRLIQALQLAEVQKLTRKYKLTSIVEQLKSIRSVGNKEHNSTVENTITVLSSMKDDESQASFVLGSDSGNERTDGTSDILSQNSMSIRSFSYNKQKSSNMIHSIDNSYRSFSTEHTNYNDSNSYQPRSISPTKRSNLTNFSVEYDRDGRLHYIPKTIARSASYDRYGTMDLSAPPNMDRMRSTGTLTDDSELYNGRGPSRSGSLGTNILYKIRREELAKGTNPSVKAIAMAFESLDSKPSKKGFFSIRKSRSVDATEKDKKKAPKNNGEPKSIQLSVTSRIAKAIIPSDTVSMPYEKSPRGGRNPFKNMGSKLVERVRRSLSRTKNPNKESSVDIEKERTPTLAEPERFMDDEDEDDNNALTEMEKSCLSEISSITENMNTFRSIQDCDSVMDSISQRQTSKIAIPAIPLKTPMKKVKVTKRL